MPRVLTAMTFAALLTLAASATPASAETPAAADGAASAMIDGRIWAVTSNGADVPWGDADAYCRALRLDGRDDWRLPTLTELESLLDPEAAGGILPPVQLDTCCLWSTTSLVERPSADGGPPGAAPSQYYWGLIFDGGIRYYSNRMFSDGRALCTRDGA
ncbi:MAG: DUF1566 domain-containing protein [bacterium]